eukprot:4945874-Amphidinium_carterae.1
MAEKERELKQAARVFAIQVLNQRALTSLRKKKIRQEFVPYWPHVKMLDSERALLKYRTSILTSIPDFHYGMIEQVDIKKWAPSFGVDNTDASFAVFEEAIQRPGWIRTVHREMEKFIVHSKTQMPDPKHDVEREYATVLAIRALLDHSGLVPTRDPTP